MTATLVCRAPRGALMRFVGAGGGSGGGEYPCTTADPVTLEPFADNQLFYRFGDPDHDNAMALAPFLQFAVETGRNALVGIEYTGNECRVLAYLAACIAAADGDEARGVKVFAHGGDQCQLVWPKAHTVVSRDVPLYGSLLQFCRRLVVGSHVTKIAPEALFGSSVQYVRLSTGGVLHTIGARAFFCSQLQRVAVPDSVVVIENSAFSMTPLRQVRFAKRSRLHEIHQSVFYHTSITDVEIPANVQSIGLAAFEQCTALARVTFAKGSRLRTLGTDAFARTALHSVWLPNTCTRLGRGVFRECRELRRLVLGDGVTHIGAHALAGSGLQRLRLPIRMRTLERHVLDGCVDLEHLELGRGLTDIREAACRNAGLREIAVPDGVHQIGAEAFAGCKQLTTVVLGHYSGLCLIGARAFEACPLAREMTVGARALLAREELDD
eukprot:m.1073659 g.1073659  ORF g.1073659 m.1073659 type:complete len:439 (+) comp24235_c0_seq13:427-1743(+)